MTKRDLKIDADFRALIPPLSAEEYDQLAENIAADGCTDSIAIWKDTIIDGHNRFKICTERGIEFGIINIPNLVTREDVKIWICRNQLGRRNLSDFARVEIALKLKPMIEAKAKEKQKKAGSVIGVRPKTDEGQNRTDQTIGDMAGVGKTVVRQVEEIQAKAAPEVIAAVKAKEISINKAAAVAKKPKREQAKALKEAKEKKPKLPKKPSAAKPKQDDGRVKELLAQSDEDAKRIAALEAVVKSLKQSDKDAEIEKLHKKYAQLEGRLQQCMTTQNEAKKDATYAKGMLAKVRAALKVKKDSDILEAIRNG